MKTIYTKWPKTGTLLLGLNASLLLLAVVWWPLRMLYSDSAYMAWRLFQYGHIDFGHLRFSSVLTQFLPWLSMHAGLDLKAFLICYSFSLQLPVFALALYAWRKKLHGTALACFMLCTLWTATSWFIPVSEMYLAAVFTLGWHAVCSRQGNRYVAYMLFLLAAFSHSGMLPALMLMASLRFRHASVQERWMLAVCLCLIVLLKWMSHDTYEQGFLQQLLHVQDIRNSYVFVYLKRTLWNGSGGILLLLTTSAGWINRRNIKKMCIHLGMGLLLFLLLALLFGQGDSDQVLEKNLIPLSLFLSLPLMEKGNHAESKNSFQFLFLLMVLSGVAQIAGAQQWALNRHKQLRALVSFAQKNCPSGKLAITGNPESLDTRLHAAWALPYESLMCSYLFEPGNGSISVKLMREEQPDSTYGAGVFSGAVFIPPLPVNALQKRGYKLSAAPYCILDAQECRW